MVHITVPEVSAWLDRTKFDLTHIEVGVEEHVANITLSALAKSFSDDVLAWVDELSTPDLVRTVITMRYAAAIYRRQYAEVSERMPSYPQNLDRWASQLEDGILSGDLDLLDVETTPPSKQPSFYPTDASSRTIQTDLTVTGNYGITEGDGQKFSMGRIF